MRELEQLRRLYEAERPECVAVSAATFRALPYELRLWYAERSKRGARPLTELAGRCLVNEALRGRSYAAGGKSARAAERYSPALRLPPPEQARSAFA